MEVLAAGSSTATPIPYPADVATGAGMTALDGSHVLVVGGAGPNGGDPGARVFTVPCATIACTATSWQSSVLTPLALAQSFAIDRSTALVTGEDASGGMHAYRLAATSVTEVPFRVARSHARAVRLPLGTPGAGPIALVGGATTIESFIP
jgi:hypothetical protein